MRYGYWLPVFGGWLRNVRKEGMEASWSYVSRLAHENYRTFGAAGSHACRMIAFNPSR